LATFDVRQRRFSSMSAFLLPLVAHIPFVPGFALKSF
jgi:hypothetical protein